MIDPNASKIEIALMVVAITGPAPDDAALKKARMA